MNTENGVMNIEIEVTQHDINSGIPRQGCACPIYWAIERALINLGYSFNGLMVASLSFTIKHSHPILSNYPLPIKAVTFIHQFDNDEFVQPFNFTIEINR